MLIKWRYIGLSLILLFVSTSSFGQNSNSYNLECHSWGTGSFWKGDRQMGSYCEYDKHGKLRQETQYAHGRKHGDSHEYRKDGSLLLKISYWNGKVIKREQYTSNPASKVNKNRCTCEDWDGDKRYGVVLNNKVLKSNVGTYDSCMRFIGTLNRCQGSPSVVNKCTCEDWDGDKRYGVVLNNKVLKSNVGTYDSCMRFVDTLNRCH